MVKIVIDSHEKEPLKMRNGRYIYNIVMRSGRVKCVL